MKFMITETQNNEEKMTIRNKGLYCYDLRLSDEGDKIETVERSVLVNRAGSIITDEPIKEIEQRNSFIGYDELVGKYEEVDTEEELIDNKEEKMKERRDNWKSR